jgi:hypothetical protein
MDHSVKGRDGDAAGSRAFDQLEPSLGGYGVR